MKLEELYTLLETKDVLTAYEEIKVFFAQELPDKLIEEENLVGILIDIMIELGRLKDFEKLLDLSKHLQQYQKELYEQDLFMYYSDIFIEYYSYLNDVEQLEEALSFFRKNPLVDYDLLLRGFKFLIYYGYTDILTDFTKEVYPLVANNDELLNGADFDLKEVQFNVGLEKLFYSKTTEEIDFEPLLAIAQEYEVDIEEDFIYNILPKAKKRGFGSITTEEFDGLRKRAELDEVLLVFKYTFLDYMHQRKMPFYISSAIWTNIFRYWRRKKNKLSFRLDSVSYQKFMYRKSRFILDYMMEVFASVWGSVYIYEFLNTVGLIKEETYRHALDVIQQFKGQLEKESPLELWKFSFVHKWGKPLDVEHSVWEEEQARFKANFSQKSAYKAKPIHEAQEEDDSEEEEELLSLEDLFEFEKPKTKIKIDRKIGRNDKVKVQYKDGSVKETKFKKVKSDIENGNCELLD